MFHKDDTNNQVNLRLADIIKDQQKTIDKLSDKLMAKNLPEYLALQGEAPERSPIEESPFNDLEELTPEEGMKLITDDNTGTD